MKRKPTSKPHAKYDYSDRTFICLICEETGIKEWVYDPWEIPKHLKEAHRINRSQQKVVGWTKEFEKEYIKNRKKPINYSTDESLVYVDKSSPDETEREKKRLKDERKSARDQ